MKQLLKILIVDDEAELRKSLIPILLQALPDFEIEIVECENGECAIEKVKEVGFDLLLMDVRMPGLSGLEALDQIKAFDPSLFVVILTAHSNLQDAVIAIKSGAYDYIEKPIAAEKLKLILNKALETKEMVADLAASNPIMDDDIETEFVGSGRKMSEIFDLINRLSQVDTTVLIRGENGTGKELVARAIHYNSPRKHGEFVAINCGAIPDELIESEFFGHEKGAFTGATERKIGRFQQANRGTIFLDEIGELKPELQVKILRVLQEKSFIPVGGGREVKTNARVIAATNKNLEKMIEEGRFREDLFYRLNVMPIFMPPLRERTEDIPHLVQYFITKYNRRHKRHLRGIAGDALEKLRGYGYPGNIRELENIIERAIVMEVGQLIQITSLPDAVLKNESVAIDLTGNYVGPLDYDRFKEETEREFIVKALETNRGKINKTVAQANIPKNTLLRKIKKYNIDVRDFY